LVATRRLVVFTEAAAASLTSEYRVPAPGAETLSHIDVSPSDRSEALNTSATYSRDDPSLVFEAAKVGDEVAKFDSDWV
jgi:hypothetical protein